MLVDTNPAIAPEAPIPPWLNVAETMSEMMKILQIVEQLMQMHVKALKDLGVDLEAEAKKLAKEQGPSAAAKGTDKPIDDLL